jgi:quercetin 2,3-dioxygenase
MEIITYIINGFLTHQDSLKSSETLGPNSIQFMTAGKGIKHSEHNLHESEILRFYQIWISPR